MLCIKFNTMVDGNHFKWINDINMLQILRIMIFIITIISLLWPQFTTIIGGKFTLLRYGMCVLLLYINPDRTTIRFYRELLGLASFGIETGKIIGHLIFISMISQLISLRYSISGYLTLISQIILAYVCEMELESGFYMCLCSSICNIYLSKINSSQNKPKILSK